MHLGLARRACPGSNRKPNQTAINQSPYCSATSVQRTETKPGQQSNMVTPGAGPTFARGRPAALANHKPRGVTTIARKSDAGPTGGTNQLHPFRALSGMIGRTGDKRFVPGVGKTTRFVLLPPVPDGNATPIRSFTWWSGDGSGTNVRLLLALSK